MPSERQSVSEEVESDFTPADHARLPETLYAVTVGRDAGSLENH